MLLSWKIRSLYAVRAKVSKGVLIERYAVLGKDVELSHYCYVGIGTIISNAKIGPYCSIGPHCHVGLGEHSLTDISTSQRYVRRKLLNKTTTFEGDNWIGAGAVIRQGVNLGFGSVIGANSTLLEDTEPFGVYVGSPARLTKYRFSEERILEILNSKWWENK